MRLRSRRTLLAVAVLSAAILAGTMRWRTSRTPAARPGSSREAAARSETEARSAGRAQPRDAPRGTGTDGTGPPPGMDDDAPTPWAKVDLDALRRGLPDH